MGLEAAGGWVETIAPAARHAAAAGHWGAGAVVDRRGFQARLTMENLLLVHAVGVLLPAVMPQQRSHALELVEGIGFCLARVEGEQNARGRVAQRRWALWKWSGGLAVVLAPRVLLEAFGAGPMPVIVYAI